MQKICTKYARNMHKYFRNMLEICNYMSEICIKYAQYIDCISHIWKKYALNMPEICTNMQIICSYMLKICSYMPKICNKYAQYIDCISRICKKYAVKICRNMQFYMQNMHKSIYCIYCIYMHSPLCWWRRQWAARFQVELSDLKSQPVSASCQSRTFRFAAP